MLTKSGNILITGVNININLQHQHQHEVEGGEVVVIRMKKLNKHIFHIFPPISSQIKPVSNKIWKIWIPNPANKLKKVISVLKIL